MLGAPASMHSSAESRISSTVIGCQLGAKNAPVMVVEMPPGIGSISAKRLVAGMPRAPCGLIPRRPLDLILDSRCSYLFVLCMPLITEGTVRRCRARPPASLVISPVVAPSHARA
jgi:hypothetical protein